MRRCGRASGTLRISPICADGSVGHHYDAVGKQDRFVDIMRDHQDRISEGRVNLHDLVLQMRAG